MYKGFYPAISRFGAARLICGVVFLLILLWTATSRAQPVARHYTLWLRDKAGSAYSLSQPLMFLSQHSINRRAKQGFPLVENDLPVSPSYLQELRKDSLKILFTSRWLNTVTIETTDSLFPEKLSKYPFVINLQRVRLRGKPEEYETHTIDPGSIEYGWSYDNLKIHHGEFLHRSGFQGQGMRIGVIDAGFFKVDSLYAFDYLRKRGGILGAWDFAEGNDSVYNHSAHGMQVLSIMAGRLDGWLIGTAPEADYFLLRSEIAQSEYPVEEFAWIAALEWADSAGVDVVNSSLGYSRFSDSTYDHTIFQLDGYTVPISRAASMAASKGMIVVNSAGNAGNSPWHYITIPADAKDILAVGAVDDKNRPGSFTSHGPSADGRVKPDVSAKGVRTVVASIADSQVATVNGTSSAAPVIAGLVACLWQEFPHKTSYEIMDAVRKSSHLYTMPNDRLGYGIPDFLLAREILKESGPENRLIKASPNPFKQNFTARFYSAREEDVSIYLTDALGRVLWHEERFTPANYINEIEVNPSQVLPEGIYILTVYTPTEVLTAKLIRN